MKPVRTCIGCGEKKTVSELIRLCLNGTELLIATASSGRGAWICPDNSCVDNAQKRRAFSRAFRSGHADGVLADTLRRWLVESND